MAKLKGYQFDIFYKPGRLNTTADSLSRKSKEGELGELRSFPQWGEGAQLIREAEKDPQLKKIRDEISQNPNSKPGYEIRGGILLYKNRLVIPSSTQLIPVLLEECHSSITGGHSSFYGTYWRVAANIYWNGMVKRVQEFVRNCDMCQRYKASALAPVGLI